MWGDHYGSGSAEKVHGVEPEDDVCMLSLHILGHDSLATLAKGKKLTKPLALLM